MDFTPEQVAQIEKIAEGIARKAYTSFMEGTVREHTDTGVRRNAKTYFDETVPKAMKALLEAEIPGIKKAAASEAYDRAIEEIPKLVKGYYEADAPALIAAEVRKALEKIRAETTPYDHIFDDSAPSPGYSEEQIKQIAENAAKGVLTPEAVANAVAGKVGEQFDSIIRERYPALMDAQAEVRKIRDGIKNDLGGQLSAYLIEHPLGPDEAKVNEAVDRYLDTKKAGGLEEDDVKRVVDEALAAKAKETQAFLLKSDFTDEQKRLNKEVARFVELARELLGEPAQEGQSRIVKPGTIPYQLEALKRAVEQELPTPVDNALHDMRTNQIAPLKDLAKKAGSAPRKAVAAGVLFGLLFGAGGYFGARYAEYKLGINTIPSAEVSRRDLEDSESRLAARISSAAGDSEKAYAERLSKIEAALAGGKAEAEKYAQSLKEAKESLGRVAASIDEIARKGDAGAKELQDLLKALNAKVDNDAKRFLEYTLKAEKDEKEKTAKSEEERKAREQREKAADASISEIRKALEKYGIADAKLESAVNDLLAKYASLDNSAKAYDTKLKEMEAGSKAIADAIKALKSAPQPAAEKPKIEEPKPVAVPEPKPAPKPPEQPRADVGALKKKYEDLRREGKTQEAMKVLREIIEAEKGQK